MLNSLWLFSSFPIFLYHSKTPLSWTKIICLLKWCWLQWYLSYVAFAKFSWMTGSFILLLGVRTSLPWIQKIGLRYLWAASILNNQTSGSLTKTSVWLVWIENFLSSLSSGYTNNLASISEANICAIQPIYAYVFQLGLNAGTFANAGCRLWSSTPALINHYWESQP